MQKKYIYISCLVIFLAGLAAYSNSFLNDFLWDDEFIIVNNPLIKDISNWQRIVTQELLSGSQTNYYRPLQVFSYAVDYRIWKLNPFGYHLTNFLIHILNAILVFILIHLFIQQINEKSSFDPYPLTLIPLFTALFWVVHPVHVEAVSYISGRADLLAGSFLLLSFLLYLRHFESRRKRVLYLSSLFLFICSLFSKEASLVFPFILVCYEGLFRKSDRFKSKLMRILPFLFIGILYIVLRLTILQFGACLWTKASFYSGKGLARFYSLLKCIPLYLGLLVMPLNLYMERFVPLAVKISDPYTLSALIIAVIFIIISRRLKSKYRTLVIFFALWFLVFLFPQSTFFFTILIAEHFLYLPSLGVFFIFVYALYRLHIRRRKFTAAIAVIAVIFFATFTFSQNFIWRNSLTFYHWMDKYCPTSFKTRNNLANIYFKLGLEDLAIKKYEEALAIDPHMPEIKKNMELVEDELIKSYKNRLRLGLNFALHHYNLACLYERKGKIDEAVDCYKKAIEINPKFAEALSNLGNVYEKQGKFEQALTQYQRAVAVEPNFAQGYFNIGVVLGNQGKLKEAEDYFKKALSLKPDYENARVYIEQIKKMLKSSN